MKLHVKATILIFTMISLLVFSSVANAQTSTNNGTLTAAAPLDTVWTSNFEEESPRRFAFTSVEDSTTTVIIRNSGGETGIIANLMEVGTFNTISSMNQTVTSTIFCVPEGNRNYQLVFDRNLTGDAQVYEALIVDEPTIFCDPDLLDIVVDDAINGDNSFLIDVLDQSEVIDFEMPLGDIIMPVTLSVNSDDSNDNNMLPDTVIDTIDDFPSIVIDFPLDDDGITVDVNVFRDDEALLDVDAFGDDLIAVYLDEDDNGDLVLDIVLGDDSGTNIADGLDLAGTGLDVNVELTEDGLNIETLFNDDSIIEVEVVDSDAIVSLFDEELISTGSLTDDLAVGDIDIPVNMLLDTVDDGLVLDVVADSSDDVLSLTGTLDNGDDNLLLVDVNVFADDDALVDVDTFGDDLIAVYLDEDDNGDLVLDIVLGDDSGTNIADGLDLAGTGLDVNVDLTEDGLNVEALFNDDSIIEVEVVDSDVIVSLFDEELVSTGTLTDDLAVGGIDIPVNMLLDTVDDGLVLDVVGNNSDGVLSLTGTLDNGDDNLLLVDVNVFADDEALLDVDTFGDDLIAVYVDEDDFSDLVINVVPGDDSGTNIADGSDLGGIGLDVNVELTEDGLNVEALFNDDSIIAANVVDNGLLVSLLEDEFLAVDESLLDTSGLTPTFDNPACTATPQTSFATINVRMLPTTASSVVTVVDASSDVAIIGQALDGTWLHIALPDGRTGYISASILSLAEVCATVDLIEVDIDLAEIDALEALANTNVDVNVGGEGVNVDAEIAGAEIDVNVGGDGVDVNIGGDDAISVGDDGINVGGDDGINIGGDDGINIGGDDGINVGGDNGVNVNVGGDDGINVNVGGILP